MVRKHLPGLSPQHAALGVQVSWLMTSIPFHHGLVKTTSLFACVRSVRPRYRFSPMTIEEAICAKGFALVNVNTWLVASIAVAVIPLPRICQLSGVLFKQIFLKAVGAGRGRKIRMAMDAGVPMANRICITVLTALAMSIFAGLSLIICRLIISVIRPVASTPIMKK